MKPALKALKKGAEYLEKLKQKVYKLKLGGVKRKLEHLKVTKRKEKL